MSACVWPSHCFGFYWKVPLSSPACPDMRAMGISWSSTANHIAPHRKQEGTRWQLASQWEAVPGEEAPLWEMIAVVSRLQFSTGFPSDTTCSTLFSSNIFWLDYRCGWTHRTVLWLFVPRWSPLEACSRPSSVPCHWKHGGWLLSAATVMSTSMSAPSVRKKSFARSSKPSSRMCVREQRSVT